MMSAKILYKKFDRQFRMLSADGMSGLEYDSWRMNAGFDLSYYFWSGKCTASTAVAIAECFGFDIPYGA